jgi:quinoprotein glucose dehydrogenase
VLGLVFLGGGLWLAGLGGSWYYAVVGALMLVSGALTAAGRRLGLWLYALVWIGTLVWALAESGLDFWLLESKILAPTVLGLWLFMPWVTRRLDDGGPRPTLLAPLAALALVVLIGAVAWIQPVGVNGSSSAPRLAGQTDQSVPADEWAFYGRTPKGDRFSPLDQINTGNVAQLKVAWSMHTGDTRRPGEDKGGTDAGHEFNFEDTPIKVGSTLYVCTGHSWVEALDATTGAIKWKFNPHADTQPDVYLACRGVAYYSAPPGVQTVCPRRIIAPVLDARLLALNADTGQPCEDFGEHGFISLKQYLGHVPAGFHFVTSPPLVLNNRVILGGWIYDNQAEDEPSGAVRAFDPLSGQLVWAWDLGRPEGQQVVHPGTNQQLTRGTPNAWGVYTADPALNLV